MRMKNFQKAYKYLAEIIVFATNKKALKKQYVFVERSANHRWYKNK